MRQIIAADTLVTAALWMGGCDDNSDSELSSRQSRAALERQGVEAQLLMDTDWSAGYCARITLKNNRRNVVSRWSVQVNIRDASVYSLWSGGYRRRKAR